MIQTLYPLADGSAFTLTTGKLLGPAGTDWQRAGLKPGVAAPANLPDDQLIARAVAVLKTRNAAGAHVASSSARR